MSLCLNVLWKPLTDLSHEDDGRTDLIGNAQKPYQQSTSVIFPPWRRLCEVSNCIMCVVLVPQEEQGLLRSISKKTGVQFETMSPCLLPHSEDELIEREGRFQGGGNRY
ncbi:unnamed protein product [Absidia cylindrospora]